MGIYETSRLLAEASYRHWLAEEVFTYQWFLIVGVLLCVYVAWLLALDKSRVRDIILLGSLCAVAYGVLEIVLAGTLGFWQYAISLVPFRPSLLVVNLSLAPVAHMLALQYSSSWKGFGARAALLTGAISFVLLPVYVSVGIIVFHNGWNYVYHFLTLLSVGLVARGLVAWFAAVEARHGTSPRRFWRLQPSAAKLVDDEEEKP
ncbi:CBO0543 family protein [Anaeroselena agilis]|uniref:CBO0543 family protein n=1 Tax=Anaeroselena agilis TaxID=3063788 RepID=A0ABU3NUQ0_9FIRM|nr:CBO0543 family protein [Selenomonadales bacterium 4137-cl]